MPAPVSARFKELVVDSHEVTARVEVLNRFGQVILDSASTDTPLVVAGGTINVDGSASFQRYISDLTIIDAKGVLVPTAATDAFSALSNNELRLSVGVVVNGEPEWVIQGLFHLEGSEVEDTVEGLTITVSAYDRARRFSRSTRITPRRFDQSAAIPIYTSIIQLLQDVQPDLLVLHDSPPHLTVEQVIDTGDDPWEYARELADSMGYELFFDRLGLCRLRKIPDPTDATVPNWTYAEGDGSALIAVTRAQSNDDIFNAVIVTGENPSLGEPVRVLVVDDDPDSPTYWEGPYGKMPTSMQSDKVRTVEQAEEAGRGHLNKVKGLTEQVTFSIVPNPAIEPGDAVRLVRAKSKFPATGPGSELLIVDSYNVALGAAGAMDVTCRQRRLS